MKGETSLRYFKMGENHWEIIVENAKEKRAFFKLIGKRPYSAIFFENNRPVTQYRVTTEEMQKVRDHFLKN